MSKLSIIIPGLGSAALWENSLASVLQNRPDGAEVIVVLNRAYDDPYQLGDEVCFIQARRGAKLIECLNTAIAQSTSEVVHLLGSGVEPVEGWTDSVLRHFRDPKVAAVAPLVLSQEEPRRVVCAGVGCWRGGAIRLTGHGRPDGALGPWARQMVGPSVLAAFYRRSALEIAGGLERGLGHAADIDLAIRLRAAGGRVLLDPQSKLFASLELVGGRPGFRAGLESERFFLRHVPQGGWAGALCCHAWSIAADFLRAAPSPACALQLLGRAWAWTGVAAQRRRQRELEQSMNAALREAAPALPHPHLHAAQRHPRREAA